MRGSISLDLTKRLFKYYKKPKIFGYDPYVGKDVFKKNNLIKIKNLNSKKFDIVINCSNNLYFKRLYKKLIKQMNKNSLIYDFWSVINKSSKILDKQKSILLINYGSETNLI